MPRPRFLKPVLNCSALLMALRPIALLGSSWDRRWTTDRRRTNALRPSIAARAQLGSAQLRYSWLFIPQQKIERGSERAGGETMRIATERAADRARIRAVLDRKREHDRGVPGVGV